MADPDTNNSPISQVLASLGLTREDLLRHSHQMRQFLTAEEAHSLRAFATNHLHASSDPSTNTTSLSRTSSKSSVEGELPQTPVKGEPTDAHVPPNIRQFGSMEAVIERKSRQKRDKKNRIDKDASLKAQSELCVPLSPSPNHSRFRMDVFMESRDSGRVNVPGPSDPSRNQTPKNAANEVLFTPHQRKYYRDHITGEPSTSRGGRSTYSPRPESPTPSFRGARSSGLTVSDTPRHIPPYYRSPLPPSSPPAASSPFSSPAKGVVNVLSSPGLMGPPPDEDDDSLPYTLPPGPYLTTKPDLSYAALVGQAILSSPDHRLTLQEIYDWITIVYPYFKRGETTWMNSIRHVLSTTICFRKVVRERTVGRTLWAIWDEDLECFEGGGFKKHLCKDMVEQGKAGKAGPRKRPATGEDGSAKKSKRVKKAKSLGTVHQPYILPSLPTSYSLPLFPPTRPSTHNQSYYEICASQTVPAEIIFPPLPSSSSYHQQSSADVYSSAASASRSTSYFSIPSDDTADPFSASPPPSSATSSFSVSLPDLTSNCSSSSPPLLSEDHSANSSFGHVIINIPSDGELDDRVPGDTDVDADADADSAYMEALEPSITLLNQSKTTSKTKKKRRKALTAKKKSNVQPIPVSSTTNTKSVPTCHKNIFPRASTPPPLSAVTRLSTPPPRPCTPPLHNHLRLSPHRTPLSHRGLHMSPSPSLAHYKSHLDPPPFASFPTGNAQIQDEPSTSTLIPERVHTPSRKGPISTGGTALFPPCTPKKLVFPGSGESPFRTPGSRSHLIYDPHDAGMLLDEELNRLGERAQDSPAGLFGRGGGLLYESPNVGSPGKWMKWW